ncbi:unnamed protein product [Rotaria sp. Silwood1]|nr:unnamed protein product [Rotaria sp. Silwood1]CAF4985675.1 unnamed protein product [Rotaria sp. Silwood1]
MATHEITPSDNYRRHRLPIKIIVKRPRPPTTPSIQSILCNLDDIHEVSSRDWSMSDSRDSKRRIRASRTSGSFLTCCEWRMLAAIVLLSVGLVVAIILLFTWPRSQTNDSGGQYKVRLFKTNVSFLVIVVNTSNASSVNTTSTTSVSSISSTTSPTLTTSSQATTDMSTTTTSTTATTTGMSTTS